MHHYTGQNIQNIGDHFIISIGVWLSARADHVVLLYMRFISVRLHGTEHCRFHALLHLFFFLSFFFIQITEHGHLYKCM